jgi:hypothetical protein
VTRQRPKKERATSSQEADIARLRGAMTHCGPKFSVREGIWFIPALPDASEALIELLERNRHLSRPFKADPQTTGAFKAEPELSGAFRHVWFHDALLALKTGHRQQTDVNWLRWFTVRTAHREGLTYRKAYRAASERLERTGANGAPGSMKRSYDLIQRILRGWNWNNDVQRILKAWNNEEPGRVKIDPLDLNPDVSGN